MVVVVCVWSVSTVGHYDSQPTVVAQTTVGHYDSQPTVVAQTVVCMGIWDRVCVCMGVWEMLWELLASEI